MKRTLMSFLAVAGLAALTAAVTLAAPPKAKNFVAHLNGANQVPPLATKATGEAVFNLRKQNGVDVLEYKISAANFGKNNKIVAAHIHCGKKGDNGGIAVTLYGGPTPINAKGNVISGTITASSSFTGGACGVTSFATLLDKMRAVPSQLYVNVHSEKNSNNGEIRGQIKPGGPKPT